MPKALDRGSASVAIRLGLFYFRQCSLLFYFPDIPFISRESRNKFQFLIPVHLKHNNIFFLDNNQHTPRLQSVAGIPAVLIDTLNGAVGGRQDFLYP
ncbi:MAG: hypothetical protein ACLFPI_01375 [Desulfobacterales bacterium]